MSLIIILEGTLLLVKASKILPLELLLGDISFVFHMILWFFNDTAIGIDFTYSRITNYGFKCTAIYIYVRGYFHFSFILYLKINSILDELVSIVYTNNNGIFSGVNVSFLIM